MNNSEIGVVTLIVAAQMIRKNLRAPNSTASKRIADYVEKASGISSLELHRFNNAIVNNNVHNSFKEERAHLIARAFIKADIRYQKKLPDEGGQGSLKAIAQKEQLPLEKVLEVYRVMFKEVIDELLTPST